MSLVINNLYAGYVRDIDILRDMSLVAREGQLTTVIGANGVGKSTLLKCVIGQLKPHSGEIFYLNEDLLKVKTYDFVRKGVAYIAQGRNVFPHLNVLENLEMGTWIKRKNRKEVKISIERIFDEVPMLSKFRNREAGQLSGGQQRILEIERSMLTDPSLILIDEPTVGLDPKMSNIIYKRLRELCAFEHRTILMVDQNIIAGTDVADYIYVLELGANKLEGTKQEFEAKHRDTIAEWLI